MHPDSHDSYICWSRGSDLCDALDRVLFWHRDGTVEPCTCTCHKR